MEKLVGNRQFIIFFYFHKAITALNFCITTTMILLKHLKLACGDTHDYENNILYTVSQVRISSDSSKIQTI